jgi:starvation-inducible DNA-binding protein
VSLRPSGVACRARMREVHDDVDEEDPTTADLLHGFITALEQYAWMVSAENRRVGSAAE